MRILGIDYGSKRIGLAISDEEGLLAFPYLTCETEKLKKERYNLLKEICKKESVEKIVIGLPISFSGKEEQQARDTRGFAQDLKEALNLPVEFENEVLTTELAKRHFKGMGYKHVKVKLDASAAAIILQSYLDKKR